MLDGLASCSLSLHQNRVVTSWRSQSQLIECDDLSTSLSDALACTFSDAKSTDAQLGNLHQAQIIGDGTDNNRDIVLSGFASLQQARHALQRDDWAMDAAHKQTLQDDLVELLMRSSIQETVELKL